MRKTLIIISVAVLIFFTFNIHAFPWIWANDSCRAYERGCSKSGSGGDTARDKKSGLTLGQLVIEGAGCFLRSNSDMQLFLNKIELSELNGMDYSELQNIINSAIENMENAKETYINLISIAKVTPYNPSVIEKLQFFDYSGFQEDNKLNSEIFKQVEAFLSNGDVTGMYIHLKSDIDSILEKLYNIKSNVDSSTFPDIQKIWRANQEYLESLLFGQYVARIFIEINNTK